MNRASSIAVNESDTMQQLLDALPTIAVDDSLLTPLKFNGEHKDPENTERWLEYFENYTSFRKINNAAKTELFKLLLTGAAADWLRSLPHHIGHQWDTFRARFAITDNDCCNKAASLWTRVQGLNEAVDKYITDIINRANVVQVNDPELVQFAVIKGLQNNIKLHILQSGCKTIDDIIRTARRAEAAHTATKSTESEISTLIS